MGRFQAADGGTIFLDEIGELPLELQPKLLRAIQEHEFERLGSSQTTRVDVRIGASTNQNLKQMVSKRRFRMDLYYRLNVFPITLPPLRERADDIPLLVRHFVHQFGRRMRKTIETIPSETMDALVRYHWPGNIRELQNVVERAVILSPQSVLRAPVAELEPFQAKRGAEVALSGLAEVERDHIVRALAASDWVI